ncbi:MAG: hypothetical protein AABX07_01770, partial [Nanoarchaeota archaeon]
TIIQNKKVYRANCISVSSEEFDSSLAEVDLIASTCPWAIPCGVYLANAKERPFAYVRQNEKKHGLKQQVEGIILLGESAYLIDFHRGESYLDSAMEALQKKGIRKINAFSKDLSHLIHPSSVAGEKGILIEDSVSKGKSSVKELNFYKAQGAKINYCLSIFNYRLNEAANQFRVAGCNAESILNYETLLEAAKKRGYVNTAQIKMLEEWREAPFEWGARHGFPPEEKKRGM